MISNEEKRDIDKFAESIHYLYKSLYECGFTSEQAFKLTVASIRKAA